MVPFRLEFRAFPWLAVATTWAAAAPAQSHVNGWGRHVFDSRWNADVEQVAAGGSHTVLLRTDGSVAVCGPNDQLQCSVPALPQGVRYVQVAAGTSHTVARRSDGAVVSRGQHRRRTDAAAGSRVRGRGGERRADRGAPATAVVGG